MEIRPSARPPAKKNGKPNGCASKIGTTNGAGQRNKKSRENGKIGKPSKFPPNKRAEPPMQNHQFGGFLSSLSKNEGDDGA